MIANTVRTLTTDIVTIQPQVYRWFMLCACLFVLFAVSSGVAHADGLFDFQMKLAKKGNAEAQFKIGEMYETGFGVKKDMEQASYWINKSARQGHEVSSYKLLYWDLQKNGVTADSKDKLDALQKKADEGNNQAQYYIGKMHAHGVGVKKNLNTAQTLLNKAAVHGVLEAERELVLVRESMQRAQLAKRRAEAKRKAQLKAKKEEARQKKLAAAAAAEKARKLEAQRKAAAQKKKQAEAQSDEDEEEQRALAEKQEHEALERERESRRRELLSQRREREAERKEAFESDPCSGKSARFLSTCR